MLNESDITGKIIYDQNEGELWIFIVFEIINEVTFVDAPTSEPTATYNI